MSFLGDWSKISCRCPPCHWSMIYDPPQWMSHQRFSIAPHRDLRCSSGTCSSHMTIISSNLPAIRKVLTFQVPTVILLLTCILLVVTPVAYFSPPSWWGTEGAVLFDPGNDRSGIGWEIVVISCGVSWANKAWRSLSLSKPGLGSKFLLLDGLLAKDKEPLLPEPDILQVTWSLKRT